MNINQSAAGMLADVSSTDLLMRDPSRHKMRIGILVTPDLCFETWEVAVFERIASHSSLELCGFFVTEQAGEERHRQLNAIQRGLLALEYKLFCPPQASQRKGLPESLAEVPLFSLEDLQTIDFKMDVLLSHVASPQLQSATKQHAQIWEYDFSTLGKGGHAALGVREVMKGMPFTCTRLLSMDESGNAVVLGSFRTNTKFSGAYTSYYAKSMLPSLVEDALLQSLRANSSLARNFSKVMLAAEPLSRLESLRYGLQLVRNAIGRAARRLCGLIGGEPDKWSLALCKGDILNLPLDQLAEIPQPKGEYRADPFIFPKDGRKYIFFESWNGKGSLGKIHVGILDGQVIRNIQPLDFGDIHVSYPCIFEHDGEIFMMPETHQRKRVEVWRCVEFPGLWEPYATALDGQSPADSCLLLHRGEWWLLTNLSTGQILDHCMELHVFRVSGPDLKNIEPHALNPVVLDTTTGRNAGRPFIHDGKLIRPAQSSQYGLYGYDLRLMEITRLSIDEYEEREVRRIEPVRTMHTTGCHHLDICGDLCVIDVRRSFGSRMFGARDIGLQSR